MVTLITDKLQQQTLDEISSTAKRIQSEQLETTTKERESFDLLRKLSKPTHKHRRNHSRNIQTESCGQDGPEETLAMSFATTGRCNSYPPAKKRICRSRSDPHKEEEIKSFWNPEPSSIWTPVKRSQGDRCKPTGARSLEFTNREICNWATPPESPIPRPVSANSALEDSTFFPLRFISEEKDEQSGLVESCLGRGCQRTNPCSNICLNLPRSHSHPCFSNIVNNGLKRRLSEIDIPRPALDFDKMKARSFVNPTLQKRTMKSSKYFSKRHSSTSPKASNSSKSDKPNVHLNVSVDLSSSLMITPTASPTNSEEVKADGNENCKPLRDESVYDEDENANPFTEHKCFDHETLNVDTDLDIKLIEEDGSLNDNEIHTSYILS